MPEQQQITRVELEEIGWTDDWEPQEVPDGKRLKVQFNPQTLKVSFSNQKAGGDQKGGGAIQYVGTGATKLSCDLLFDVTAPLDNRQLQPQGDVRYLTQEVAYFIKPVKKAKKKKKSEGEKFIPPGIRFIWGSFIFEGVVDSINETLEFFSHQGKPLRATVSLALSRQDIFLKPPQPLRNGGDAQRPAQEGDTSQKLHGSDWQEPARENNVENPRNIPAGTPITT